MSYEHKPESGSLFKNDKKEKESHPDYKGSALIDGVEFWVSAWVNETQKDKTKYFGLKFQKKDDVQKEGAEKAKQAADGFDTFDDDIPF